MSRYLGSLKEDIVAILGRPSKNKYDQERIMNALGGDEGRRFVPIDVFTRLSGLSFA